MGGQIGEVIIRHAGLAKTQRIAGSAQLPVLLCNDEAVITFAHGLQALARGLAELAVIDKKTARRLIAAPDPAAQLVELAEPEALRAGSGYTMQHGYLIDPGSGARVDEVVTGFRVAPGGALERLGDGTPVEREHSVAGGCIANGTRVTLGNGATYFVKRSTSLPPALFRAEAVGLMAPVVAMAVPATAAGRAIEGLGMTGGRVGVDPV